MRTIGIERLQLKSGASAIRSSSRDPVFITTAAASLRILSVAAIDDAAMSSETIEFSETARAPDLRRDIAAIALVAITLLLTVSVVTRDPADPLETPIWPLSALYTPDVTVYPANSQISNACGYWGALIGAILVDSFGMASALVIGASGGVATALMMRGRLNAPVLRSLGGCAVLLGTATAFAMLPGRWEGMPVVGAGGSIGAMTSLWLLQHFAPAGAWILTLTVLAIGLLMTTDYALVYAGRRLVASGAHVSRRGLRKASSRIPLQVRRRRQPFTDLEDPITIDGDQQDQDICDAGDEDPSAKEPAIRVKRRTRGLRSRDEESSSLPDTSRDPADDAEAFEGGWEEEDESGDWAHDEESAEADCDAFEDEDGSGVRELELDDETLTLREDSTHELPPPKVRLPKRKQTDERNELIDAVRETAPEGTEAYVVPSVELLELSDDISYDDQLAEVRQKAKILESTFKSFGFNIRVVEIETGPVIAQYEVELEAGLRLSKITGLADDLAIALRVPSVRIVAPIPGKNTVGIEVPNETRQVVRLRDVIEESDSLTTKMNIPVFLGKDVSGSPMVVDLAKMPHLLIAGRTGTGKSVCLNALISSILMCCRPDEVRMLMIDPKMVELSGYGRLPHLMHPVITDMKKAEAILAWAVEKMEERYSLLAKVGVRHINSYNGLGRDEVLRRLEVDEEDGPVDVPDRLPFIVIVADEMADLMMTAGKDVEQHIIRLAQKSRAVGIHLILATQKPTVDVITGLIKSNLPARLSFQVASKTDSRVVLDENGAEKLLGNGDMLFLWPGTSTLIRGQGTYLSDEEIDRLCGHCSMGEQQFVGELLNLKVSDEEAESDLEVGQLRKKDELYESAIEVVVREQRGSLSLIQRCLGIGYGRAARLVDYMAEDGIVGEYNGSKSREVLLTMAQWQQMQGLDSENDEDLPGVSTDPAHGTAAATVAAVERKGSRVLEPQHEHVPGEADDSDAEYEDAEYEDVDYEEADDEYDDETYDEDAE